MKPAYEVSMLEADGVVYGIHLGWGARAEHHGGIEKLAKALCLRRHVSGVAIACSRDVAKGLFVDTARLDGIDQTVIAWEPSYNRPSRRAKSKELQRYIDDFEGLWSSLPDEQDYRARPLRGAWDEQQFVVHARTAPLAQGLSMLGQSFLAEDLAIAYCPPPPSLGLSGEDEAMPSPYGLLLLAPGLCPAIALPHVARLQQGLLPEPRGTAAMN